jgi:hypothetical protein
MKKRFLRYLLLLAFVLIALPTTLANRELSVTVYNQDFAVIKDIRDFDLKAGRSELMFSDVAAKIDPTSVQATSPTNPAFAVLEQNFEFNLVSSAKLLQKMIDEPVTATLDSGRSFTGKLLCADANAITLQTVEGIKLVQRDDHFYELSLATLPADLLLKPTLVWHVTNSQDAKEKIEIAYQTGGFNWNADYNVLLNPLAKTLNLSGWVTVTNTSGAAYPDAHLKLVAGEVHKVKEPVPRNIALGSAYKMLADVAEAAPAGFEERGFAEYHLYDLGRQTTLKDNETKQIEFVNVRDVPYTIEYLFEPEVFKPWRQSRLASDSGEENIQNLNLVATIENKKENKLGIPLPAGKIRLYQQDAHEVDQFVGQDSIEHTPKDEKVRLTVGEAFDVVGSKKVLNRNQIDQNIWTVDILISIRNHKNAAVPVVVRDTLLGGMNWSIQNNNLNFEKKDFQTIEFKFNIAADSEQEIRYTVRYERNRW